MHDAEITNAAATTEIDGDVTRADALRAIGTGLLPVGLLVGGFTTLSTSAQPASSQDSEIMNLALLLEYLEAGFYRAAIAEGTLDGELLEFAEVAGGHEDAHVDYLRDQLGDAARPEPKFDFSGASSDPDVFARNALLLEDTGVGAYNGQATNLTTEGLAVVARVVSVDARHAAWIRSILNRDPAPSPTDSPLTAKEVLAVVDETGFVK